RATTTPSRLRSTQLQQGSHMSVRSSCFIPPMPDLLEMAGFRIRSANRADCAHCSGSSIRTVSFTSEVAHCFRCGCAAHRGGLANCVRLLRSDPASRVKLRAELRHRRAAESTLGRFERWRGERIRQLSTQYRLLGRTLLAHEILLRWPTCEPAWEALASFYHA